MLRAPDERRKDVIGELKRPTFSQGLSRMCRFISYSALKHEIEYYGPRIKRQQPEFLDDIAETCQPLAPTNGLAKTKKPFKLLTLMGLFYVRKLVPLGRLERPTRGLGNRCSIL